VDWRTALRKFVNREDLLGPVRLALLRVIDPVEWYMAKNDEERRRSHRRRRPGAAGWNGYATAALRAFLDIVLHRPLYAYVADHNVGSRRVLEKCGIVLDHSAQEEDVLEHVLVLTANSAG
jgi:hypothetical protein